MTLDETVRHVTRDHGKNLGVVMGDLLFQDVNTCFLELLSNGYDADAQRVNVTYEPESDLVVVEDDGEGMDYQGLENFFRMGDSVKLANPLSPGGRQRIGKFGIASLVLRRLSQHHVLDSYKGNEGLRVEERFTHEDKDDKPIRVTPVPPKMNHGTRITMDQLRFSPVDRRFDLDLLRKKIAIEMPLSPEFTVYVNGEQVTPRAFKTAVEYVVEMDDRLVGEVTGSVYYSSRVLPEGEHGIFVKVHGRAVGGANLDLFGRGFPESLARRIYGVIHADGLSDIVGFDRSRFIEHPKVHKLSARLREVLKEIQNDMKVDATSQRRSKGREDLQELLGDIGAEVGRITGTNRDYTITFDAKRAGKIAALDEERGVLYINPSSPAVRIPKINPLGIREALLTAAQHAVAQQGIPDGRVRERYVNLALAAHRSTATSRGARFVDLLDVETDTSAQRISSARLYDYTEAARVSGIRNPELKRLVASGIMEERKDRLLGAELINAVKEMDGNVSLYEAVRLAYPEKEDFNVRQTKEKSALSRLSKMEERELPDYVRNLAAQGNEPFYVIETGFQSAFSHFLEHWQFPEQEEKDDPTLDTPVSGQPEYSPPLSEKEVKEPTKRTSVVAAQPPSEPVRERTSTPIDTETPPPRRPVPTATPVVVPDIIKKVIPPPKTAPAAPPLPAAPTLDDVVQTSLHAGKYTSTAVDDGVALVYVMNVQGSATVNTVEPLLQQRLRSLVGEASLSPDRKWSSYLVRREQEAYVIGVFASPERKDLLPVGRAFLDAKFERFNAQDIDIESLAEGTYCQKEKTAPLQEKAADGVLIPLLDLMKKKKPPISLTNSRYALCEPGEHAAVLYLMQVNGETDFEVVSHSASEATHFACEYALEQAQVHGQRGGKIYTSSFLIRHDGSTYILGIFSGSPKSDVEHLAELFEESGFEDVYVADAIPAQLARETVQHKALKPLVSTTRYANLVQLMLEG